MGGTSYDGIICSLKLTICFPLSWAVNLGGKTLSLWRLTSSMSHEVKLIIELTYLLLIVYPIDEYEGSKIFYESSSK